MTIPRSFRVAALRFLAALSLSTLLASPSSGQATADRVGRAEAEAAIAQLRSPYCPGRMLENCTSAQAGALRDSIYDLATQGSSTDELVEWMLARHGEEYRGVPQGRGAGLWAWVIPPAAVLAALALLIVWFRSNRSPAASSERAASVPLSDSDRNELSDALRAWERSGDSGR